MPAPSHSSSNSKTQRFAELAENISRRQSLQRLGGLAFGISVGGQLSSTPQLNQATASENSGVAGSVGFDQISHAHTNLSADAARCQQAEVPSNHRIQVVMSWGAAVVRGTKPLDYSNPTVESQETAFGYNNDFVGYLPLPRNSSNSGHGLLCVNHEYTDAKLMFPHLSEAKDLSKAQVDLEMSAHGHSIVEIRRKIQNGKAIWERVADSQLNRRISCLSTDFVVSGPAAGHDRMKTVADPEGRLVRGTVNNCAGGTTPWGTVLFAEENFQQYFLGDAVDSSELKNHQRYEIGTTPTYSWHLHDERFDTRLHPNEPNRFGWVVEFDPYDPESVPVKRTALGRMRHEGAATSVSGDGRLVVYMGDDQRFEYLYKFVSEAACHPTDPSANKDLLDRGTLYVAKFSEDQTVTWLPLEFGTGPLTPSNGFGSQAEVLIETRRAADLLGATPMDRPEDVEENPNTGRVYALLTNNSERDASETDSANPRGTNPHGHIIELQIPKHHLGGFDHAATSHRWELFLLAGEPAERDKANAEEDSQSSWLSCPDNCTFDNRGRIWIATDGGEKTSQIADGIYVCSTAGDQRAVPYHFLHGPRGAEVCGPCFTPDNTTFFVAIQHPGEGSTYSKPSTRWPNPADSQLPPLPSVIAVTRDDPLLPVG